MEAGGIVKRLLTHPTPLCLLASLWLGLLPAWGLQALASEGEQKTAEVLVKIKNRTFVPHRETDSTMTWIVQKTDYEDGLRILTLAGVQHEDAFGLSVVLLDDVTPQKQTVTFSTMESEKLASAAMVSVADNMTIPDELSVQLAPQLHVQIRSLLVNLADLRQQGETKESVPSCSGKSRRAVVFLRPAHLQRQLNLNSEAALQWTRFGRAACVRWSRLPETMEPSSKIEARSAAPSRPDEPDRKN